MSAWTIVLIAIVGLLFAAAYPNAARAVLLVVLVAGGMLGFLFIAVVLLAIVCQSLGSNQKE